MYNVLVQWEGEEELIKFPKHFTEYSSLIALDNPPPPTTQFPSSPMIHMYIHTLQRTNSLPVSKKKKKGKRKKKKKKTHKLSCQNFLSLLSLLAKVTKKEKKNLVSLDLSLELLCMIRPIFPQVLPQGGPREILPSILKWRSTEYCTCTYIDRWSYLPFYARVLYVHVQYNEQLT